MLPSFVTILPFTFKIMPALLSKGILRSICKLLSPMLRTASEHSMFSCWHSPCVWSRSMQQLIFTYLVIYVQNLTSDEWQFLSVTHCSLLWSELTGQNFNGVRKNLTSQIRFSLIGCFNSLQNKKKHVRYSTVPATNWVRKRTLLLTLLSSSWVQSVFYEALEGLNVSLTE